MRVLRQGAVCRHKPERAHERQRSTLCLQLSSEQPSSADSSRSALRQCQEDAQPGSPSSTYIFLVFLLLVLVLIRKKNETILPPLQQLSSKLVDSVRWSIRL